VAIQAQTNQTPRHHGGERIVCTLLLILALVIAPFAPLFPLEAVGAVASTSVAAAEHSTTPTNGNGDGEDGHEEGIQGCHISAACSGWALPARYMRSAKIQHIAVPLPQLANAMVSLHRPPPVRPPIILIRN